jgi:hypothetical protein
MYANEKGGRVKRILGTRVEAICIFFSFFLEALIEIVIPGNGSCIFNHEPGQKRREFRPCNEAYSNISFK